MTALSASACWSMWDGITMICSCACVKEVMNPGGLFLLHYISALQEHPGDAWIKKYIFPGGVIPSLREIINIAGDHRFYTLDVESLRRHYNKTLLCWNKNFQEHKAEVVEMFGDRFTRMWELYLCACAATFHERYHRLCTRFCLPTM